MLRALSLGAGVQSSTLLLMSVAGELPKLDAAIFANTQWEPEHVYRWLEYLKPIANAAGIPLLTVSAGNIREDTVRNLTSGVRIASLPAHVTNADGQGAILRRQCTKEYKIEPLEKEMRRLLGVGKGERVPKDRHMEVWIGISLDEIHRMKESRNKWATHVWPLIERRMSRRDCLLWMERHGYPEPPKSACIGCPYKDNKRWRETKDNSPAEWADAVEFDGLIRIGLKGVDYEAFLHRSRKPLSEVDLSTPEDHGQETMFGFNNECDGACGT